MKRIHITSKQQPRVRHVGPSEAPVEPAVVAAALAAEPVITVPTGFAPPTFASLRHEIANRLISTGGRPALEGVARRLKIPLSDADWARLVDLADHLAAEGVRPTPGQVASALIHSSLANLDFAAAMLRTRDAFQDEEWTQGEPPTGEKLFGIVAQFRPFAVPETMEAIPEDVSDRAVAAWAESFDELEKVAS